jgi:type IV fimbrial biogenesis protein FimT
MNSRRNHGFTLIELMITLTVAAIIVGLAIPSMRDFIRNNRLSGAANDLLHAMQVARTEAIKRQSGNVVVCGTTDSTVADAALTCNNTTFTGWFVFQDTNSNWQHDAAEPVLERHALVDPSVSVVADQGRIVSYAPTGFGAIPGGGVAVAATRTMVICDMRGNATSTTSTAGVTSTARTIQIQATGRARVSALKNDVTAALAALGATCP